MHLKLRFWIHCTVQTQEEFQPHYDFIKNTKAINYISLCLNTFKTSQRFSKKWDWLLSPCNLQFTSCYQLGWLLGSAVQLSSIHVRDWEVPSGNNQTNILIEYLCSVSEIDAGIGDPRSLPDPTPIPWSLILWFFRSAEIQCWRAKDLAFTDAGTLKLGRSQWEGDTDGGGRGGVGTPVFGWRNMWIAPYWNEIFCSLSDKIWNIDNWSICSLCDKSFDEIKYFAHCVTKFNEMKYFARSGKPSIEKCNETMDIFRLREREWVRSTPLLVKTTNLTLDTSSWYGLTEFGNLLLHYISQLMASLEKFLKRNI